MERYTLLLTTEDGVVLYDYHRRRLNPGGMAEADGAFARFARQAAPGVWAVWLDGAGAVRAEPRVGSRLRDGMPTRLALSPVADGAGPLPKPASPCPYDAVRTDGVATLLTSPDGTEIYEASVAAVLGWDGRWIVCVPAGRPRVWSTAEQAVREHLAVVEAPILTASAAPLLLVNAVKGTSVIADAARAEYPPDVRAGIERLFVSLTALPG
ncbi:MAG: hypothetical protein AAB409_04165 [Gemmatimonadota bacterium]|mgnify:FL=1